MNFFIFFLSLTNFYSKQLCIDHCYTIVNQVSPSWLPENDVEVVEHYLSENWLLAHDFTLPGQEITGLEVGDTFYVRGSEYEVSEIKVIERRWMIFDIGEDWDTDIILQTCSGEEEYRFVLGEKR